MYGYVDVEIEMNQVTVCQVQYTMVNTASKMILYVYTYYLHIQHFPCNILT